MESVHLFSVNQCALYALPKRFHALKLDMTLLLFLNPSVYLRLLVNNFVKFKLVSYSVSIWSIFLSFKDIQSFRRGMLLLLNKLLFCYFFINYSYDSVNFALYDYC